MKASLDELPVAIAGPGFESRAAAWGDMVVARERCDVDIDGTEVFKTVPGGACTCHHWGHVLTGRLAFRWPDRELVVEAGETYYAEPGHVPLAVAGTEVVELSPRAEHEALLAVLSGGER